LLQNELAQARATTERLNGEVEEVRAVIEQLNADNTRLAKERNAIISAMTITNGALTALYSIFYGNFRKFSCTNQRTGIER
jgi:hypothetical protein